MRYSTAIAALILLPVSAAVAQNPKTLAATMDVFVFPSEGQDSSQQSKDEAACYNWATNNTGSDPFELAKQQVDDAEATEQAKRDAEQAGVGRGAQGALRGAAVGALIGEIADDDAGQGARTGAAVGLIRGRRVARAERHHAIEDAEDRGQAREQATATQIENFKKAFSVCLEAKDYLVKY